MLKVVQSGICQSDDSTRIDKKEELNQRESWEKFNQNGLNESMRNWKLKTK